MQLYATKRRGDFQFTVSYTLGKVLTNASGNGDNDAPEAVGDLDYLYGPATFDRRHAFVNTLTYRLPWLRDRGGVLEAVAGGWEVSSKYRFQSGQYFTATGNSSIGNRRADYIGGEIDIDGDELQLVQHGGVHQPAGRSARHGDGRTDRGPVVQADGHLDAEELPLRRALQPHADHRRVQPVQHGELRQLRGSSLDANNAAFGTIDVGAAVAQFQFGVRFDF